MSATHRSRLRWACVEIPRRLLCQAEGVSPKYIKIGFGCNGLGLPLLWFFALYQLGLSPGFVRLTLVSAVSPSLVFVCRMFFETDAMLIGLAPQTVTHCFSFIFICGEAQFVPTRFSSSDGKGTSSSSTVPYRLRSHETFAASRIALISFAVGCSCPVDRPSL